MRHDESLIGKVIGSYEVLSELGRGGMGHVYKAHEMSLQRVVALKVLPEHLVSEPSFVKRFEREAQSAARLSHPNIVTIYAIGQHGGLYYIAMEYVKGQTLNDALKKSGKFSVENALHIVRETADALDLAHQNDIIHRDVKPHNIMLDAAGRVKVMDFGLAKLLAQQATELTSQGTLLGTPKYMSPEQCQGLPLDPRSDIYSLGVVFYEMLTGGAPFSADTPIALIRRICDEPCPPITSVVPDVPKGVARLVDAMLSKHPAERPASAGSVVAEADALLRGEEGGALHSLPTENVDAAPSLRRGETKPLPSTPTGGADEAAEAQKPATLWKGALAAALAIAMLCAAVVYVSAHRQPADHDRVAQGTAPIQPEPALETEPASGAQPDGAKEPADGVIPVEAVISPDPQQASPEAVASAQAPVEDPSTPAVEPGPESEAQAEAPAEAAASPRAAPAPEPAAPPESDEVEAVPENAEPSEQAVHIAQNRPVAPPATSETVQKEEPAPEPVITGERKEYADGRFVDRGDGTVMDTDTMLLWQKGDSGKAYRPPRPSRTTDYRDYIEQLDIGGRSSWRLPTKAELMSLQIEEFEGEPLPFVNSDPGLYWCFVPGRGDVLWVFNWTTAGFEPVLPDSGASFPVRAVTGP